MLSLSFPSRSDRLNHAFIIVQIISSNLVIASALGNFFEFLWVLQPLFVVNSFCFYFLLLGMNVFLLVKKTGEISLEMFLALSTCFGTFLMYAIGPSLNIFKPPFYSEIAVITLGSINLLLLYFNISRRNQISITVDKDTRSLLIVFTVLLGIKMLLINDADMYLDDQKLFENAITFCNNGPELFSKILVPYFDPVKEFDVGFEIAYSTSLGIVAKSGLHVSVLATKYFVKAYMVAVGTLVVFPVHAFVSRAIKARIPRYATLVIIVCNQWFFIESPYLLTGIPFTLFFTLSFYYFVRLLESEGPPEENLSFALISGIVALGTRYNGLIPFAMQAVLLLLVVVVPRIQSSRLGAARPFKWLGAVRVPRIKQVWAYLFAMGFLYIIFSGVYQAVYYVRNGITLWDYALHIGFGYFGPGNVGQFTPVDSFTFGWLWERFSYNFPWYATNLTQFTGFIHVFGTDHGLRVALNLPVSILLSLVLGSALVHQWYVTGRKEFLSFLYQFSVFMLLLASVVLWGETYFQFYRWSEPLLIMLFPPVYPAFVALFKGFGRAIKREIDAEKAATVILLVLLGMVLYGTLGFLAPLATGSRSVLRHYIFWQFFGVPLPAP